jgi:hypothetical protein
MIERTRQIDIVVLPDGRLDAKNAATYLGLSDKTLAMMRCQGTGPCFIKRGRIFYYQEDLDTWLAQAKRVTSTAQAQRHAMIQRADEKENDKISRTHRQYKTTGKGLHTQKQR